MRNYFIKEIEHNLQDIINDNTLFDVNLTDDYKYKKIISNLTIDNSLTEEDVAEINETLASLKNFISLVSTYCKSLLDIQDEIEKNAKEIIDNFTTKKCVNIINKLDSIVAKKFNVDSLDDLEDVYNEDFFFMISGNKYLDKMMNNISQKELNLVFNNINNENYFKELIESINTLEEIDILKHNINKLFNGKNYKELDNISFETAMLAYDKGLHKIFQFTRDEFIDKLNLEQICLVFSNTSFSNKNIESKLKIVSKNIKFKDLYSNMNLSRLDIEDLYKIYDYIDSDSLDYIIKNNLYNGINENNYILTNKDCLKKIFTERNRYNANLLHYIPASVIDDDLYKYIVGEDNVGQLFKYQKRTFKFLESYDLTLKIAQDINMSYEDFLKCIPKKCLKKEFVVFCMLNGMSRPEDKEIAKLYPRNSLRSRNLDDIKDAIDKGYKCSNNTILFGDDEVSLFIKNGQPEIIDYVKIKPDLIIEAIEYGYKFDDKNNKFNSLEDDSKYKIISYCIENNKKDYLLGVYRNYGNDFIRFIRIYIKNYPNYKSCEELFNELNIMDEIIDITIFKYHTFNFDNEDWLNIISNRYNKEVLNYYMKAVNANFLYFDINKDNINTYFNENGPTREFYDMYLYDNQYNFQNLLEGLYNSRYKEIYKDEPEILGFINFKFKISKLVGPQIDYEFLKGNIDKYFDINGPKKELYDAALFNKWFFTIIYSNLTYVDFDKIYSNQKNVIKYINFTIKYDTTIRLNIKGFDDIDKYFDEEGPTKETFDFYIYETNKCDVFNKVFGNDRWLEFYKEPYMINYLQFRLNCKDMDFSIINKDISKYFDENGFTKELYALALSSTDTRYIEHLNSTYPKEELDVFYKDRPSVLTYSNYVRKYGQIFLDYISFEDIDKYFDKNGYTEELKKVFLEKSLKTEELLSNLAHDDKILNSLNIDFVNMFEYYLIDKYLNEIPNKKEKYDYLINNIGPKILFNFNTECIKKLHKYDINDLDKFFKLFNTNAGLMSYQDTYNNFIVSIINYKFKREYKFIREIFTNMNSVISNASKEDIEEYINLDHIKDSTAQLDKLFSVICHDMEYDYKRRLELKQAILECKNLNEAPLRKLCREYLECSQKKYLDENKDNVLLKTFYLPLYFDKEDGIKKLSSHYLENMYYSLFDECRNKLKESIDYDNLKGFIDKLKMTKEEYDIILSIDCDKFKLINEAIENRTKPDDSVKKEFSLYKRFIVQYAKYEIETENNTNTLRNLETKMIPQMPLFDIDFIKILNELDMDIYLNSLKKKPELFDKLKKVCTNYGLGRLPESLNRNFDYYYNINLPGGINNIGLFITRFEQILENKEKLLRTQGDNRELQNSVLTFMETVNLISSVNSETYEIKRLLGSDEYLSFISNKGPNDAPYSRLEREDKLSLIVDYLYSVDSITIPPKDIIIKTEDTKYPINLIVGNRTNPANICHGERTGACMRVGGVGEGLFLKCITDKNWFHIRLEDPDSHEYISRVSGFRNGDTLYLNQLRYAPSDSRYTNEDLQKYIKKYAESVIEDTKDSEYPIENVFINTGYAMEHAQDKVYILGSDIQKEYNLEGIENLILRKYRDIWTDVKNSAYLLATTKEGKLTDEGYIPLKNGPDNTVIYKTQRDKIYGIEYVECDIPKHCFISVDKYNLEEKINRVNAMKQKLLGIDYKYEISDLINNIENIVDGYVSSDWYVYIDKENNIHSDYISKIGNTEYHQAEEAINEMNYFKDILVNKYNLNNEVKHAR